MSNVYAPPDANVDDVHRGGSATVTAAIVESLRGTKGWVLLVAICLFLFAAFGVMGGVGMVAASAFIPAGQGMPGGMGMILAMGAFYLLFAIIYGLLGWYLIRFHGAASRVVREAQVADLEVAMESQRKFWRMTGIMIVAGIVLMILFMGAAVMIPAFVAASGKGG